MRHMILLLTVLFMVVTAMPALAQTICVGNAFGQYLKFDSVSLVKGSTTVLRGEYHWDASDFALTVPFVGAVTLLSDGVTTQIGITSYPDASNSVEAVAWFMVGNKKFAATGTYYNSPYSGNSGADTWTNVSCTSSPFKSVE